MDNGHLNAGRRRQFGREAYKTGQKHDKSILFLGVPFNIYWARLRHSLLMTKVVSNELKNILLSALLLSSVTFCSIHSGWDIKCFVFLINLWWLCKNVGNCKNNWDATLSLLLFLLPLCFSTMFSWLTMICVCVCGAYWFLLKDKWNPIKMFNLHILHKKCNGKSIKNNNNNSKLVIKSLITFFRGSENEFLVFIFSKNKMHIYFIGLTNILSKRWLSLFPKHFQIPLGNGNSSLDYDIRYCYSIDSCENVSFFECQPTGACSLCLQIFWQTDLNELNK